MEEPAACDRQRQVAVRDTGAERTLARALGIDMDPLAITRDPGEVVHHLLRDGQPLRLAQRLTDQRHRLVDRAERDAHGGVPSLDRRCATMSRNSRLRILPTGLTGNVDMISSRSGNLN